MTSGITLPVVVRESVSRKTKAEQHPNINRNRRAKPHYCNNNNNTTSTSAFYVETSISRYRSISNSAHFSNPKRFGGTVPLHACYFWSKKVFIPSDRQDRNTVYSYERCKGMKNKKCSGRRRGNKSSPLTTREGRTVSSYDITHVCNNLELGQHINLSNKLIPRSRIL